MPCPTRDHRMTTNVESNEFSQRFRGCHNQSAASGEPPGPRYCVRALLAQQRNINTPLRIVDKSVDAAA